MDDTLTSFLNSITAQVESVAPNTDNTPHMPDKTKFNDTMAPSNSMPVSQQNFYPTPNSASMHAVQAEKQFMSPFPSVPQNYTNLNSETSFAELDELLFTPMLSPAMTPMQQFSRADLDWEQFDQNFFALTSPAIDENIARVRSKPLEHVSKKQRVAVGARLSRQASPANGHTIRHKKDTAVAAVAKENTPDSTDGISSVDLEAFSTQQIPAFVSTNSQPITPSMLMSIQRNEEQAVTTDFPLTLNLEDLPQFTGFDQPLQSPSLMAPPSAKTPRTTPSTPVATTPRDIRPRAIAPAHGRSRSVASSPAIGPHNPKHKTSPDLRAILPGGMSPQVGAMLASKSNYQHIVDGTYDQLNISYPEGMTQGLEVRRTSHKAAEQKRRDHLKECFEQLRTILPDQPDAMASKVVVLKKGYDHIVHLHQVLKDKDAEIARLKSK